MKNVMKSSDIATAKAIAILRKGGIVVLPTDTNYNVFTSPFSQQGVERIFSIKKRSNDRPLSLCFSNYELIKKFARLTGALPWLIKKLWPSPISFIAYKKPILPNYVTCNFPTVALASHQHPLLNQVIGGFGLPLAGTSANLSGTGLVKNIDKVYQHLGKEVELIVDDGELLSDSANTIVDLTFDPPVLARAGDFALNQLLTYLPNLNHSLNPQEYKELVRTRLWPGLVHN